MGASMLSLDTFSQSLVHRYGLVGVFLGMTVESAGIPLPSEVIMPVGGLLSPNLAALAVVALVGTAGNLAGSWVAYGIGAVIRARVDPGSGSGSAGAAAAAAARGGDHWRAAYAWWDRRGGAAVLVGRMLPGIRTYISFPAGAAAMPGGRFTAYTVLGSAVWSTALALAGYLLGKNWGAIAPWFQRYTAVVLALVVLGAAAWWWAARRRARSR